MSVALPVYNGEELLERSVRSILTQDHENLELIISDNASSDGTEEMCRTIAAGDRRVRYERSEVNRGLAWNWNRCVSMARGDFFKWAAADDEHAPAYVRRTLERLRSDRDVSLAHCRTVDIDETGQVTGEVLNDLRMDAPSPHERFRELTRRGYSSVQVFGLVRTETLRKTALHGAYPRSDRVLLAELGLHGRLVEVDEVLFRRREYAGRVTRSFDLRERYPIFTGEPVRGPVYPQWRLLRGFLGAVSRAPLTPVERLRCVAALLPFCVHGRGSLKRELLSVLPAGGSSATR